MQVANPVADEPLYQDIVRYYLETGAIARTAKQLEVSEVRVRKVLLTEELWSSKTSIRVQQFLDMNMTTAQIAEAMHSTVKAVQQYLPYSRGIYNGANPSAAAKYSAEYRRRIRMARERVFRTKSEEQPERVHGEN